KLYNKYNIAQQYHIGAARDASDSKFESLGPDTGFDYISDQPFIAQLGKLLSLQDKNGIPKTIVYPLDSIYYESVVTLLGCFQSDYPGKLQLGSGWWFNDQLEGMKKQLEVLSQMGVLSLFVGMLTDSRSYLSFPRHEYFRRLLCEHIGAMMEKGYITQDINEVVPIIEDICYYNIKNYLAF
ncbi:MAG: glucuronate isomerase, partial [Lactovum sp.]